MTLQAGVYKHYKGPLYLLLGVAHDANADTLSVVGDAGWPESTPLGEREVVVYVPLTLDSAHFGPRMAVRTRADWESYVHDDGSTCEHARDRTWCPETRTWLTPRFAYLGEHYTPEMIP